MIMRHYDRIARVLVGTALDGTPSHVIQLSKHSTTATYKSIYSLMVPQLPMPDKAVIALTTNKITLKTVWSTCSHCTPVHSAAFESIILCAQLGSMHSSQIGFS